MSADQQRDHLPAERAEQLLGRAETILAASVALQTVSQVLVARVQSLTDAEANLSLLAAIESEQQLMLGASSPGRALCALVPQLLQVPPAHGWTVDLPALRTRTTAAAKAFLDLLDQWATSETNATHLDITGALALAIGELVQVTYLAIGVPSVPELDALREPEGPGNGGQAV